MQVPKPGVLRIDADRPKPGLDPLQQVGTAVIALNERFHGGHARLLPRRRSQSAANLVVFYDCVSAPPPCFCQKPQKADYGKPCPAVTHPRQQASPNGRKRS
jgi:hypothetical protein